MFAIWKREFLQSFKSFISIGTIIIFIAVSYYLSDFINKFTPMLGLEIVEAGYISGLSFLILGLGFLFVFSIFHDTLNREIESRTIRFLVTKTSRTSIIFGKLFGILSYWLACLVISFSIIMWFSHEFYWKSFIDLFVFLTYIVSLCILFSMIITRRSFSMFIGLIIGLVFPIFGIWSMASDQAWLKVIKYISPYYYLFEKDGLGLLIILCFAALFIGVTVLLAKRRDY